MKTKIETKDLAKIVNPFIDGIVYKGQTIDISKQTLDNYINNPNKYNLFSPSDDIQIDFYRNMALYVINSNGENKFIILDLNSSNPFNAGQMEFIKNIYTDTRLTYINLDESGENLNLIKAKKLYDVTEEFTHIDRPIKMANDNPINKPIMELLKITKENPTEDELLMEHELEKERMIEAVEAIISTSHFYRKEAFVKFLQETNKELVNSDEFKIRLLDKFGYRIMEDLLTWNIKDYSIDFTSPALNKYLVDQVSNRRFELLTFLFEFCEIKKFQCKDNPSNDLAEPTTIEKFDFKPIINRPEVIHYLKNKFTSYPIGNSSRLHTAFGISSCYKYLEPQYKDDESIIRAFMENITPNKFDDHSTIDEDFLYQVPLKYFNHKGFLTHVCSGLHFDSLKIKLEENNIEPTLLSDPKFILSNAIIPPNKLEVWVNTFLSKEQITKEFVLDILSTNEQFYSFLHPNFSKFASDIDVILRAIEGGLPYEKIEIDDIRDSLITPTDNPQFETVKVGYVIANDLIMKELENDFRHVFVNENDLNKFKNRYLKPEYLFLTREDGFYDAKDLRKNSLYNLTQPEEISEILDYIRRNELDCTFTFQSSAFYASLNPALRKNKFLVEEILELNKFPYDELDETLKFNSDVALAFLKNDQTNLHHISPEFFNNREFILGFTKLMDEGLFDLEKTIMPANIRDFFNHNEVKENFHEYLEKYINFQTLQNTIHVKEEEKSTKRMKI